MRNLFLAAVLCLIGSAGFAQSDITGEWHTGMDNTIVLIEKQNDVYSGKIISSDNENVKADTVILKNVKSIKDNKLEGELFSLRKGKWYDAEIINSDNKLTITISAGLLNKSVEWIKHHNN
jgi:uncharacterized protein (DUF2147 family)